MLPRLLLLLSFLLSPALALAQPQDLDVYLLLGQSNMAGRGTVAAEDTALHPRIWMLDAAGAWVPAREPLHFDKPELVGVGPGLAFARAMVEADPGAQIGLVPAAVGGSPIEAWTPGGFHAQTETHPWDDALRRARLALAGGTLRGILWHQGESDATPERAPRYAARLDDLVGRLRAALDAPDAPFVAGTLGDFFVRARAEAPVIQQAIAGLPRRVPHTAVASAAGLGAKPDSTHFDAAAARTLGRRYAAAMQRLQRPASTTAQPRNVLLILTDEQRFDTSAPYGNDRIQTPHLNRLGAESVVFERAYVTQPVCSPARASILTGRYPHSHGVTTNNIPLPDSVRTLAEWLPEHRAAYVGKWHLGDELEAVHGFDVRVSIEDLYTLDAPERRSDYHRWLIARGYTPDDAATGTFSRGFAARLPAAHTKAAFVTEQALSFLDAHAAGAHGEAPFLLALGFLEPHTPNTGPYDELHDPATIPLDTTYCHPRTPDVPLRYAIQREDTLDAEAWRSELAKYWGLVHLIDQSVGAVLERLEALGLADETIVVFTSEHGMMRGQFGLTSKRVLFDGSARVPLMLRAPGLDPAHVAAPVSQIDLVPTLLDLLERPTPEAVEGESLLPLVRSEAEPRPVFIQWNPFTDPARQLKTCPTGFALSDCERAARERVRAVVTPDAWKLVWSDTGPGELYDLTADPYELDNRYEDAALAERRARMQALIRDWQRRMGDDVTLAP